MRGKSTISMKSGENAHSNDSKKEVSLLLGYFDRYRPAAKKKALAAKRAAKKKSAP